MNPPHDGDRDSQAAGDGKQPPEDPYVRDARTRDPYPDRDPAAKDPVNEALDDRAADPPPPGTRSDPQRRYEAPEPGPDAPDPRRWAPTPAPEPDGPSRRLPYGDDATTVQYTGVDDLLSPFREHDPGGGNKRDAAPEAPRTSGQGENGPQASAEGRATERPEAGEHEAERHEPGDAFAHLFRDQGRTPASGTPAAPPQPRTEAMPAQTAQKPEASSSGPYGGRQPLPDEQFPGTGGKTDGTRSSGSPSDRYGSSADPAGSGGDAGFEAAHAAPAEATPPPPEPDAAAPEKPPQSGESGGGRAGGLLRSSAIMAAGTMVSRLTGFIRSAMVVAAIGAAVLGDTYQLAITLPTMLYILTVGGGLNSVFVPQLVRAMKEDGDGGEAYANRLLTLVTVILGSLTVLAVLAAPLLVRVMSVKLAENPQANDVTVTFVRYCLPSIFFMGIHVVMGQILNARGRFGAMMWTPVLNNIVIMATVGAFLWVYGSADDSGLTVGNIPPEGVRLLGIGTLLGLVVQALAMIPYLRASGFRIRPRFDWRGHGLGKAAKLAKWTVLFVLANQAGVLVVTQLSTWAQESAASEGHAGAGWTAYSQAQLIWNMPQAIITVSVMAALLPRLSRAASDGDTGAVRDDISQGLRNSAVAIVPIAFGFLALGVPMCTLIYGPSGIDAARSMGYALMAFGVGLIPFSVQYVVLRAFYAYEDTRTPFFNTVVVAIANAVASTACFLLLPARWAVVGMAASYGLAYVVGVGIAWRRLRIRLGGDLDTAHVLRTYIRLAGAAVPATVVAGAAVYGVTVALGSGTLGSLASLVAGGIALGVVFVLAAKRMRIAEMTAMVGMVRARLGR
ncbi:murein biosynthesis integral membrane protein MurJ [Streptomyces marispadix]|uniref:Murein biosynthesis integral membrane protein MurJ n=1 Tax=Streptomyces marispadix TaxID=2922868 RepID=A0ABS9SYW4_9ACTN|nr:murein biosynthesis integral membrane protein MurJ [Streptomyces marispadix]MCH6161454.1 murein biosynthesis integral membrane protein MurJ [Streptomyces marispadix]